MRKIGTSRLLYCGISAFCLPIAAQAQVPTPVTADSNIGTTDIVVTATRRQERLQDVPMSVSVATGEQLQKFNIFDVKDVSQLTPGLELTDT